MITDLKVRLTANQEIDLNSLLDTLLKASNHDNVGCTPGIGELVRLEDLIQLKKYATRVLEIPLLQALTLPPELY